MRLLNNVETNTSSGIYSISSTIDNRKYIGSAINLSKRADEHRRNLIRGHYNNKLKRFYKKYGEDSLIFNIIEECTKDILLEREQYYIDNYDSVRKGFNICPIAGNTTGRFHSNVTKRKIGLKSIGRYFSEEARNKMSVAASKQVGETGRSAKLKNNQVKLIKQMLFVGYSSGIIADYYKVATSTIINIQSNQKWKNIEFIEPSKCLISLIENIIGINKKRKRKSKLLEG